MLTIDTFQNCFKRHEQRLEIEIGYMRDNRECIMIVMYSTWSHCFVGIVTLKQIWEIRIFGVLCIAQSLAILR